VKFATFSEHIFAVIILCSCSPFWWPDLNLVVVFLVIVSRPASLLASNRAAMFYLWYLCFHTVY